MTFKDGWLERQLKAASTTVNSWSPSKQQSLAINRSGYACSSQSAVSTPNDKPKQNLQ